MTVLLSFVLSAESLECSFGGTLYVTQRVQVMGRPSLGCVFSANSDVQTQNQFEIGVLRING